MVFRTALHFAKRGELILPESMLPIAAEDAAWLEGYAHLQRKAHECAIETLDHHALEIEAWHRFLTLILTAVRGRHEWPDPKPLRLSHRLRYSFIVAATLTSKTALETTLAGQYVQALAMSRSLLETWMRLAYIGLDPQRAMNWYAVPPQPQGRGTMLRALEQSAEHQHNARIVEGLVEKADKYSHPSPETAVSMYQNDPERAFLGTVYRAEYAAEAMRTCVLSTGLITEQVPQVVTMDDEWKHQLHNAFDVLKTATG